MSVRSSIISLLFLTAALGLGYMAFVERDSEEDQSSNQATLDRTADQQAQEGQQAPDGTPAGGDQRSILSGSADRHMDDVGPGPHGKIVTVPLKERERQAYRDGAVDAGPGQPKPSTAADLGQARTAEAGDQGGAKPSSFRVVDRAPKAQLDERTDAGPAGPAATTPSFDIVRVDPQGNTVLAGRAAPFAEVEVKAGEAVIDRVTATASGEWVSTPLEPLASGDQELSLVASNENKPAIPSRQVVVVSIPAPDQQVVAAASDPVAVLLDREKGGEGRILQAPGRLQGEGQLALKLVDYDDEGAIKLSGEAPPGVPVRIYIDNEPAGMVIGDSKGSWITTLDRDLPGGDYTLRLDQLDKKGQTVARLETPLTRVTTPPVQGEAKVDYVVVQPGNSLWRIARRLSGDGFNYVYIFEANQAQIRNPDVIYPGQVFEVPAATGIAG